MTFKAGKSGNPKGRPPAGKAIKEIQRLSYNVFIEYLNKCAKFNRIEMASWLQRPEATMFELMFGNLIAQAAKGDKVAMEMLLNRLFGKVADNIRLETPSPTVIRLSDGGQIVMGILPEKATDTEATDVKD